MTSSEVLPRQGLTPEARFQGQYMSLSDSKVGLQLVLALIHTAKSLVSVQTTTQYSSDQILGCNWSPATEPLEFVFRGMLFFELVMPFPCQTPKLTV